MRQRLRQRLLNLARKDVEAEVAINYETEGEDEGKGDAEVTCWLAGALLDDRLRDLTVEAYSDSKQTSAFRGEG